MLMSTQPFIQDVKPPASSHLHSHVQPEYCRFQVIEEQSESIVMNEQEVEPSSSRISSQLSTLHTDASCSHENHPLHSPPREAEAPAIREVKTAARKAEAAAIRQAHATAARKRDCQRAREEEAAKTMTQFVHGSIVTYSAGLDIPHLITAFETCTLHIKNLPLNVREDEVRRLFTRQRTDSHRFHLVNIKKGTGEKLEAQIIADADAGRALAEMLDGFEFKDETLAVEVSANSIPEGMSVANSGILTIFWRAPSMHRVAKFFDMVTDKMQQLFRRRIIAGRHVQVEINTSPPGRSIRGFQANPIETSHLPHSITNEEAMVFTRSLFVKRLTSQVEQLACTLRDEIERAAPNKLKQFDLPSESPRPGGVVFASAHFSSWDEAHAARTILSYKRYGNQFMWFHLRDPMHFTITIPLDQYTTQKAQWDVLLSSVKETKAYRLNVLNAGNITHIHLAGSAKESIGKMKVRVESLARGDPVEALKRLVVPQPLDNNYSLRNASEGQQACPICMEDMPSPHQLGCGHAYCVACLSHYISSSLQSAQFPLTCPGDEIRCDVPLPIPTIQHFIAPASFNRILEAALHSYASKHPEEFKFCRTPECSQIYRVVRPGESPKSLHCPSCFAAVCNGCNQDAHEGLTCADDKLRRKLAEQDQLRNDAWIASQDGRVNKCPRCSVIIEKVAGCDDMRCRCGAYICWRCMRALNEQSPSQRVSHYRSCWSRKMV